MNELLTEHTNNSRKTLWQEIGQKVNLRNKANKSRASKTVLPVIETELIKWHFERYILFNKLKDEHSATISDFRKFVISYYGGNYGLSKVRMGFKNQVSYLRYDRINDKNTTLCRLLCSESGNKSDSKSHLQVHLDKKFRNV